MYSVATHTTDGNVSTIDDWHTYDYARDYAREQATKPDTVSVEIWLIDYDGNGLCILDLTPTHDDEHAA